MVRYRNVQTGREWETPAADEWLEASSGWERIEEPSPKTSGTDKDKDKDEGSKD